MEMNFNILITRMTLLILKPWSNFCLQILIILILRICFIEHVYADSWYNLSYWIDLSDAGCNMDKAMGYYPENESIKPYVITYTEEAQKIDHFDSNSDSNEQYAALVKTEINDLILLSQQQLSIDELLTILPHYTDSIYELEKDLRYIDTYEYQLLEAEILKTKSLDLINIVCIKTANHMIYNDYLHKNPRDPVGLQHQLIINGINSYKKYLQIT